jgi:hypothetical protein
MQQQIERIKIYGERNTGTNFMQQLTLANFETEILSSRIGIRKEIRELNRKLKKRKQGRVMRQVVLNQYFDFRSRKTIASDLGWKHMRPPTDFIASLGPERDKNLFIVMEAPGVLGQVISAKALP